MPIQHSLLTDSGTGVVLAASPRVAPIVILKECLFEVECVFDANFPNYTKRRFRRDPFFLARLAPERYPEWSWNRKDRKLVPTRQDVLTEGLRKKSQLAVHKFNAITQILFEISAARYRLRTGVDFQDLVYAAKERQAQHFKDSGYPDEKVLEYPYVMQYADLLRISPRQAADDILLKAKMSSQILAKTELLRLKYLKRIKDAKESSDIPKIIEDFLHDYFIKALV